MVTESNGTDLISWGNIYMQWFVWQWPTQASMVVGLLQMSWHLIYTKKSVKTHHINSTSTLGTIFLQHEIRIADSKAAVIVVVDSNSEVENPVASLYKTVGACHSYPAILSGLFWDMMASWYKKIYVTAPWRIPLTEGQWCATLLFSLLFTWTNCWTNNLVADDLRRHGDHVTSL